MTSADTIKEEVAGFLGVPMEIFKSRNRQRKLAEARFMAMALMRSSGMGLMKISDEFDRDHSTILHGIRKTEEYKFIDKNFKAAFEAIEKNVNAKLYKEMTYKITEDKILDDLFVKHVIYPKTDYMEFGKGFIVFKENDRMFKIQITEVFKKVKK